MFEASLGASLLSEGLTTVLGERIILGGRWGLADTVVQIAKRRPHRLA